MKNTYSFLRKFLTHTFTGVFFLIACSICYQVIGAANENTGSFIIAATPAPSIGTHPSDASVCEDADAVFSITATNAGTYQWQVNKGTGFVTISDGSMYSGATTATLNITAVTADMDTYKYRCVVTGSTSPDAVSNNAALTVKLKTTVMSIPAVMICEDEDAIFDATRYVSNVTGYQWQQHDFAAKTYINLNDGTGYTGTKTAVLTIKKVSANLAFTSYRLVAMGLCTTEATSDDIVLNLNFKPAITTQPVSVSACAQSDAVFTASVNYSGDYQWQENKGTGYADVTNGTAYSGTTSTTLTVKKVTENMDGYTYRIVATNSCPSAATSDAAVLTVDTEDPVFTSCPSDAGIEGGLYTFTVPTATDNCSGVTIVQTAGLASGSMFPEGATIETFEATDASGNKAICSFIVTVSKLPTSTHAGKLSGISIYPNPASDALYISSVNASTETYTILLQDLTGRTVFRSGFNTSDSNVKIELGNLTKGIYILNIGDSNNMRIEKIIVE